MFRYIFLLISLFIFSCTSKEEIGETYYGYDIICLKEDVNLDINTNFDVHTTTTCIRSECFYVKYQKSTFIFAPEILEKTLTTIDKCVK